MPQVVESDEGLVGRAGAPCKRPDRASTAAIRRPAHCVDLEMAAEHGEMTSPDPLDDDHLPAEPGVPGVMDLAGFSTVGLLSRCCTTASGVTRRWAVGPPSSTSEPDNR